MKEICTGDVYFLSSPFQCEGDAEQTKRLAYLLGTVPARPAIVVREPYGWDELNNVMVVPSYSGTGPAITMKFINRLGQESDTVYRFAPHNIMTVPVTRLKRRIGRLTDEEFKELIYAVSWIQNPDLQQKNGLVVPPCYKDVWGRTYRTSDNNQHLRPDTEQLMIDHNLTVSTDKADYIKGVNGAKITFGDTATGAQVCHPSGILTKPAANDSEPNYEEKVLNAMKNNTVPDVASVFGITATRESGMHDTTPGTEEMFSAVNSILTKDQLAKYCGRFKLSDAFYKNTAVKRDIKVLTHDEIHLIMSDTSKAAYLNAADIYDQLQPVDALLYIPRLPTRVLCEVLDTTVAVVRSLKTICNILHDLGDAEYKIRLDNLKDSEVSSGGGVTNTMPSADSGKLAEEQSWREDEALKVLRPYLNERKIMQIPDRLAKDFLSIPKYKAKRVFVGKGFEKAYHEAVVRAKNHAH